VRQGGDNPPPCLGLGGLGWGTVPRSGCCAWRQGQIGANAEKSRDDKRLRGKRPLKEVIFLQARYAGGGRGTGDVIRALWQVGGCFAADGAGPSLQLPREQELRGLICSREDFT